MSASRIKEMAAGPAWLLLVVFGFWIYYPGLNGPFLFDDYPNLSTLGLYGGIADWESFKAFVLGGFSGPTGRPLSLLTFLLDANTWPTAPYPFKYTNVLFHLLNGTLLFIITLQILGMQENLRSGSRVWIAILVAGLWLLHPYLVSTTLYIVQRMAMLSAMFCFIGILTYLYGRVRVLSHPAKAYFFMTAGVGLCTVLATFSKENGAILALLVFCIEVTIVKADSRLPPLNRLWKWVVLILPSLALGILVLKAPVTNGWFENYSTREFSPYERVLTQFRVVLAYIQSWFVPSVSGGELFYDELVVSRHLFSPLTTFFSAVTVIALIGIAILKRRSWSVVSFTILFYFCSQAIESTTIGLEMKFDHRIYLGSAFLFLPLILWMSSRLKPLVGASVGVALILTMAGMTFSAASLWGDYQTLSMVWAVKKPDSVRSQTEVAQMLFSRGREEDSRRVLNDASDRIPDNFRLRLTQVLVQCVTGGVESDDLKHLKMLAKSGPYRHTDFSLLSNMLTSSVDNGCKNFSSEDAVSITQRLIDSSSYTSRHSLAYAHLHYFHGLALLQVGDRRRGLAMLDEALKSRSSLHMRMNIAAYKASSGLYNQALADAVFVEKRLESGEVTGKAAVESPPIDEVRHFIRVVREDIVNERRLSD